MIMGNEWQLLKFGGTSVSNKNNWDNIIKITDSKLSNGKKVFIVHSALSGVSNKLEHLIELSLSKDYSMIESAFQELVQVHQSLINDLKISLDLLDEHYQFLRKILSGIALIGEVSDRVRAVIMAQGELWSTQIGQAYLSQQLDEPALWLDAREYIVTQEAQDNYLSAYCDYDKDDALIDAIRGSNLIITQGFIGSNQDKDTVLLGRGGSDTSAAYFAAKIQAELLEIWTDVPGIFSANPNQIPNARLLKQLNYEEAQEMASAGAKVLHPRAIRPAQKYHIPILIRSTIEPDIEGTRIHHFNHKWGLVKAITAKQGITLISMESQGMWQQSGFLADLFSIFKKHQVSIDLVSTSETNVTVSLDSLTQVVNAKRLQRLTSDLAQYCRVSVLNNCSAVSIVGQNVRAILHKIAPAFSIFETYKVYLLSQAASDLNLTFVIDDEHCEKVISSLHELLISNNPNSEILGPTAKELRPSAALQVQSKWWQESKQKIIQMMQQHDNAYLYHKKTLQNNIQRLQSLTSIDSIFFAMKANNNEEILQEVYQSGLGFECVSFEEVKTILNRFADISTDRIFFTPNFAQKIEYQQALAEKVIVSLDSDYPLRQWPTLFSGHAVFLRIDPNVGKGHHENVRTAGSTSKFGIPITELDSLLPVLEQNNIQVIGLHAHAGSGILTNEHWAEHAELLAKLAQKFPQVKYLNLGGGFGIKEREQQSDLLMEHIDQHLLAVKEKYPDYQFWIEPGRYLVANAGVLVTKVTQVKQKQSYYYIGVNTGMNSLMRPALYGSYHPIVNLTRYDEQRTFLATIVGPICESTDKLGIEIPFPETKENDIILIDNTGAYGSVMANHYNMRKPAPEICV